MSIKVLVVDDTDHVRDMLAAMLDLDGFDVVGTAASGQEAISLTDRADPNVIVMDYKMPDMDGLAATRKIHASHPQIPVILYTAYLDNVLLKRAADAGVSLCVGKVEGIETLEKQISALSLELADVEDN